MSSRKAMATNIPIPKPKPLILNGVPDEEVKNLIKGFEDTEPYFYRDSKGYMTIGVGQRIPTVEQAQSLPMVIFKDQKAMRPATPEEIAAIYQQVKSLPFGQDYGAEKFYPKNNSGMQDIGLEKDSIDAMFGNTLHDNAQELRRKMRDLDSFPPGAQKALLDMQFNLGDSRFRERYIDVEDGIEKGWPKLFGPSMSATGKKLHWKRTGRMSVRIET